MNDVPDRVPEESDWAGYEEDLDAQYAHRLMFGKTMEELLYSFRDLPIERGSELRFMPRRAFQYYVFTFVRLFASPAESLGQSTCADVFLSLLCEREAVDPGSVAEIYPRLRATVQHVAANQAFFDADVDIYGDFRERAAEIEARCATTPSHPQSAL